MEPISCPAKILSIHWEPYSRPENALPILWEPYSRPKNALPIRWEPYSRPKSALPTRWEPHSRPKNALPTRRDAPTGPEKTAAHFRPTKEGMVRDLTGFSGGISSGQEAKIRPKNPLGTPDRAPFLPIPTATVQPFRCRFLCPSGVSQAKMRGFRRKTFIFAGLPSNYEQKRKLSVGNPAKLLVIKEMSGQDRG